MAQVGASWRKLAQSAFAETATTNHLARLAGEASPHYIKISTEDLTPHILLQVLPHIPYSTFLLLAEKTANSYMQANPTISKFTQKDVSFFQRLDPRT